MNEMNAATQEARFYTFPVSSGLLSADHVAKIGDAIWTFLWCVDRTTSDVMRDGERRGRVLGGYLTATSRIAAELGLTEKTVQDQLEQLAGAHYLQLLPEADGYIIEVRHSIKWKNRRNDLRTPTAVRGGGPAPVKSLVESLKEKWAAREEANKS
jgi:hypothetical protein